MLNSQTIYLSATDEAGIHHLHIDVDTNSEHIVFSVSVSQRTANGFKSGTSVRSEWTVAELVALFSQGKAKLEAEQTASLDAFWASAIDAARDAQRAKLEANNA